MAEKENILQELPGRSASLTSLIDEDYASLYPSSQMLKENDHTRIKNESKDVKSSILVSLNNFQSPKSKLKRSKPVDPSQRPLGLFNKKASGSNKHIEGSVENSKRHRNESDYSEGACRLKPKRLKFTDEACMPLNFSDASPEYFGSGTTDEEDIEQIGFGESEKDLQEIPLSELEDELTNENDVLQNYGKQGNVKGLQLELYENNTKDNSEIQLGATPTVLHLTGKNIIQPQVPPPILRNRRYIPGHVECTVTSSIKEDATSEIEFVEISEYSKSECEDRNLEYAQSSSHFSSPIISGQRSLLTVHSLSASNASISSPNLSGQGQIKSNFQERGIQDRNIHTTSNNSPMISGWRRRRPSANGSHTLMPLPFFDRPRSTSTPSRNGHFPLLGLSQEQPCSTSTPRRHGHFPLIGSSQEQVGPSGDAGYILPRDHPNEIELFLRDLPSEEEGNTIRSEAGFSSQPLLSQEANSSRIRSLPTVNDGEFDRSTIYYPESSSEPDRHNVSGDINTFLGLEPIYQPSSLLLGGNGTSRSNHNIGNQRGQQASNVRNSAILPSARRHLNFSPMINRDHVVPRSVMDPED